MFKKKFTVKKTQKYNFFVNLKKPKNTMTSKFARIRKRARQRPRPYQEKINTKTKTNTTQKPWLD